MGATVQSAQLTINVKNATTGEGYFIYAASRAWNESQATWTNATSGSAWRKSLVNWVDTGGANYTSLSALKTAHGWESHGHDIATGAIPSS